MPEFGEKYYLTKDRSTIDQNNKSTIAREKSRRREQVVVGLLGKLLRAGPFRCTIFFMYAAYLAVSGEIVKATWTIKLYHANYNYAKNVSSNKQMLN